MLHEIKKRLKFRDPPVASPSWSPFFDDLKELVVLIDANLMVYQTNLAWQQFTDSSAEKKPAVTPFDLRPYLYPEDIFLFKQALLHDTDLNHYALRIMNSQQQLYWFHISVTPITRLDKPYWVLICRDQTAQVKKDEIKQAQQRSLQDLLGRIPVMLYRSRNDRYWTMEYVSQGCEKITGYAAEAFLNTPLYGKIIHPDDTEQVWLQVQDAIDRKTIFNLSYRIMHQQGEILAVQEIGQAVYSNSDMVLGLEGAIFPKMK